jgi:penicillin-binding protein 1A
VSSVNSYYTDAVIDDVVDDLVNVLGWTETEAYKAIYQGGLSIYTTQDLAMQEICDTEVNNLDNYTNTLKYSFSMYFEVEKADGSHQYYTHQTMLSYYQKSNANYNIDFSSEERCYEAIQQYQEDILEEGDSIVEGSESVTITLQPQVALTVIDQTTGEVKALVGGRGEKAGNRTLNRATDTPRQPGSTFKIIGCYAPGIDTGAITLATVQDNAPYTVGTKTYRNFDDSFTGFTTVRQAITTSINIVTVKNLEAVGINTAYQYAQEFGFSTLCDDDKNLGFCLGGLTNGVTNLELTAAYGTIANSGEYMEPKFYTVVYDHDGNVLLDKTYTQESHRVLKETTAWLLTSAMEDVLTIGNGSPAYFGSSMAQAGKSGTTSNSRDSIFAGYTPYYTCVVWGGYDDNAKQEGSGESTSYTKKIWKAIMSQIHEGLPYKDFVQPSGITTAVVCKKSGKLAVEGLCDADPRGSMVTTEYFTTDTVPTETCDHHVALSICAASGMIADVFCPADQVATGVYIVGGEEGTSEYELNATEEFLNARCTVHTAGSILDSTNSLLQNGTITQTSPGASSGGHSGGGSSSSGNSNSGTTSDGVNGGNGSDTSTGGENGSGNTEPDDSTGDNANGGDGDLAPENLDVPNT